MSRSPSLKLFSKFFKFMLRVVILLSFLNYAMLFSQVKLGEPGYKERYYAEKFEVSNPEDIDRVKKDVVSSYPVLFLSDFCLVCYFFGKQFYGC